MTIVLSPKDPSEKVVIGFDFSLILEAGETLSTIESVLVTVTGGFDENKDSVLVGPPAIDETNTAIVQSVAGGVDNTQYHLTALANTNQGRRLAVPAVLPVYTK